MEPRLDGIWPQAGLQPASKLDSVMEFGFRTATNQPTNHHRWAYICDGWLMVGWEFKSQIPLLCVRRYSDGRGAPAERTAVAVFHRGQPLHRQLREFSAQHCVHRHQSLLLRLLDVRVRRRVHASRHRRRRRVHVARRRRARLAEPRRLVVAPLRRQDAEVSLGPHHRLPLHGVLTTTRCSYHYTVFFVVVGMVVPFVVISVCYCRIFAHIRLVKQRILRTQVRHRATSKLQSYAKDTRSRNRRQKPTWTNKK